MTALDKQLSTNEKSFLMKSSEHIHQEQVRQIMQSLRLLVALCGHAALADLKRYLSLSLQAEALRQQGFTARVCGRWQRWLIVIESGRSPMSGPHSKGPASRRSRPVLRSRALEKLHLARKQGEQDQSDGPSKPRETGSVSQPVSFSWPFWL